MYGWCTRFAKTHKSVTNTQQITKAMKMVASARLRRAQTKAESTRPTQKKLGKSCVICLIVI